MAERRPQPPGRPGGRHRRGRDGQYPAVKTGLALPATRPPAEVADPAGPAGRLAAGGGRSDLFQDPGFKPGRRFAGWQQFQQFLAGHRQLPDILTAGLTPVRVRERLRALGPVRTPSASSVATLASLAHPMSLSGRAER
jgi:hypothetical protein